MLKLVSLLFCLSFSLYAQPWVMFSDMDDTYLYDQASGQVYIRKKNGGKNYEDTFVKMGVIDNAKKDSKPNTQTTKTTQDSADKAKKEQEDLIKKAQELQRSIQGSIFENQ
ncbi:MULTISPECIES: hypothetical protein [Helicobacter]|uniref:Periplasmic protein n=1 Tax=Helicobacter ibis TaxID=2962633 RepID=A0ABT4VF50_9HELI|nr:MULTISPECIES: hypothetical protein [Helicobacter]MDA3967212.1 hypothetical protein [Helicobacter sp. WB40]MDA3969339.1 hypothetical protein [Helicobacter ibis]